MAWREGREGVEAVGCRRNDRKPVAARETPRAKMEETGAEMGAMGWQPGLSGSESGWDCECRGGAPGRRRHHWPGMHTNGTRPPSAGGTRPLIRPGAPIMKHNLHNWRPNGGGRPRLGEGGHVRGRGRWEAPCCSLQISRAFFCLRLHYPGTSSPGLAG